MHAPGIAVAFQKEAVGALTGDKRLKREGKADQAVGKIKQKVEKVIDKAKDALS
jgi:uncharacterized protein YjbJ (UPF0337 family)